ncbi:hypothetical protein L3Q82_013073 [Scortum barcoo]|uniref:Uncharacterized protein n=1 Tax=Scortum barcoo TaxID=214431 RepID=A0ACB8VZK2_9TELE|nr:hypothetical protein L3Q82_013073 [Scortum barcoo]
MNLQAEMMKILIDRNLDQKNIIKYNGGFGMYNCLEFEILDISLGTYLRRRQAPMRLQDSRTVIQQLAVAFDALKTTGVIRGDVKTTNIMLVDHEKQTFKVKLIDFGLAIFKHQAELLQYIIDLVGPPRTQYLLSGWKWKVYYNQTHGNQWTLKWDKRYRITPSGILNHPFITMRYQINTCEEKVMSGETSTRKEMDPKINL